MLTWMFYRYGITLYIEDMPFRELGPRFYFKWRAQKYIDDYYAVAGNNLYYRNWTLKVKKIK